MAFCIQCGMQNPDDAVFCLGCGQALYRPPKPRRRKLVLVLSALAVGAILIATGLWLEQTSKSVQDKTASVARPTETTRIEPSTASVLTIIAFDRKGSAISQGSAFVLTSDGLAGSNYHVLEGATRASASSSDGRVFDVGLIDGADLDKDLVIFQLYTRGSKVKPHDLSHVTLGASTDLVVGEKVIAIGSPQGLENTVSDGILSAIREVDTVRFLQITAPVSPGSSGGPILNSAGQMIGIATFQLKKGQNLNFAVAVDHLKPLLDQHLQLPLPEFRSIVARRTKPESTTQETSTSPAPVEQPNEAPSVESPVYSPLTGQFGGVIHNESSNVSAEFAIFVNDDAGQLSGCMLISQPLFGSGTLEGSADADKLVFSVTSAIGKITALGTRKENEISGTYVVEHGGSRPDEEGSFTLHKESSKGLPADFDPAKCPTDAEVHK
jgi:S1-C subfamily serine protease